MQYLAITVQLYQVTFVRYFLIRGELSPIKTYSQISLTLDFALRCEFKLIFAIADLFHPVLDVGFLHHYSLLLDARKQRLVDITTSLSTLTHQPTAAILSPPFFVAVASNQFHARLSWFTELTDLSFKSIQAVHSAQHFITTSPLVFSRPRRSVSGRLKKIQAEFEHTQVWSYTFY